MLSSHLKAMGLPTSSISPCLFTSTIIEGKPPIYVGIFMLASVMLGTVDFMGQVSLFLGIEFRWIHHSDGHVTVHLTQKSYAESLVDSLGFSTVGLSSFLSPYHSGLQIDSVSHEDMSSSNCDAL